MLSLLTSIFLLIVFVVSPHNFFGLINPAGRLVVPMLLLALLLRPDFFRPLKPWLAPVVGIFTVLTLASYAVLQTHTEAISDARQLDTQGKAEERSVFAYNDWLYKSSQFHYFNYRVFIMAERYEQARKQGFTSLIFRTGPIVAYRAK